MDLPSFLWLWRIAAWSMGGTLLLYGVLAGLGGLMTVQRLYPSQWKQWPPRHRIRFVHKVAGILMVSLVLLLLAIGVVGTLGHYGKLGHSWHLPAGLGVVILTILSAGSAFQIKPGHVKAREIHVAINVTLLVGLVWVSWTGWEVVQKYLQ